MMNVFFDSEHNLENALTVIEKTMEYHIIFQKFPKIDICNFLNVK